MNTLNSRNLRSLTGAAGLLMMLTLQLGTVHRHQGTRAMRPATDAITRKLGLNFEVNRGQFDDQVQFLSRGPGYTLFLTPDEAVLSLRAARQEKGEASSPTSVVRMRLVGADQPSKVSGQEELPGKVNYFFGDDPSKWRANVPTYAAVRYADVYPGVDLIYHGHENELEYDFVVAPGADPHVISRAFDGVKEMDVNPTGDLVLNVGSGTVIHRKPVAYQDLNGKRHSIDAEYVVTDNRQVGFAVGPYDHSFPLVIDPILTYATYWGGSGNEDEGYVAVDQAGYMYLTGVTTSTNFPVHNSFQPNNAGAQDAFVTKFTPDGSQTVYSTYLGGSREDLGRDVTVDGAGNAYVSGQTYSTNFPLSNPIQGASAGRSDGFVAVFGPGGILLYSTYWGGNGDDDADSIALDSAGNIYVSGSTVSTNLPVINAVQSIFGGAIDGFVTKISADGSAILLSTYLGGSAVDVATDIAVDASNQVFMAGLTESDNFPALNALQPTRAGGQDAFVTAFNVGGSILYSTYVGGSGNDVAYGIAVETNHAYITGATESGNFPTVNSLQPIAGGRDVFVTKLSPTGSAIEYSTYFGGSGRDDAQAIALDSAGNMYISGFTNSLNYPTTLNAPQATYGGGEFDAFVMKLQPNDAVRYSTYRGGNGRDIGLGLAVRGSVAYISGGTHSTNFATPNAIQHSYAGGFGDSFLAKIEDNSPPLLTKQTSSITVDEGQAAINAGTYSDVDVGDNLTLSASVGVVTKTGTNTGNWSWSFATIDGPMQSQAVTITANDGNGNTAATVFTLNVNNVAPLITSFSLPAGPLSLGSMATVSANFTDAGIVDTHTCTITWDDGQITSGLISETDGSGSCTGTRTYSTAGVYTVQTTVTDKDGAVDFAVLGFVVIYDPNAGFVTGGGWIDSPTGAYAAGPTLTGRANFGFVSKYQQGAATPVGHTEFQFKVANLNFSSSDYDWLVAAGAKAQYKGRGTVNGTGGYSFLLTVTDGQLQGGGGADKFRIKVWDATGVVYDNVGGSDDLDNVNPQEVSGGSIIIHKN